MPASIFEIIAMDKLDLSDYEGMFPLAQQPNSMWTLWGCLMHPRYLLDRDIPQIYDRLLHLVICFLGPYLKVDHTSQW